jgi:hypothetical protein
VWVAPFSQIADWQRAVEQVQITALPDGRYRVSNPSPTDLVGLTLQLPTGTTTIDLGAGKSVEW